MQRKRLPDGDGLNEWQPKPRAGEDEEIRGCRLADKVLGEARVGFRSEVLLAHVDQARRLDRILARGDLRVPVFDVRVGRRVIASPSELRPT